MALTIKQIAHALQATDGNVTEAAQGLGITRFGLQKRIAKSEELQQVVKDARESLVDLAESEARKQIKQGNTAIIIFTLKTLGKERGYVERQEMTGRDGADLRVLICYADTDPNATETP